MLQAAEASPVAEAARTTATSREANDDARTYPETPVSDVGIVNVRPWHASGALAFIVIAPAGVWTVEVVLAARAMEIVGTVRGDVRRRVAGARSRR